MSTLAIICVANTGRAQTVASGAGAVGPLVVVDFARAPLGPFTAAGAAAVVTGGVSLVPVGAPAGSPTGGPGLRVVEGALEVVDHLGQRMLRAASRSTLLLTLPARTVLPTDFTVAVDLVPKECCQPEDLALEGTRTIGEGQTDVSANLLWRHDDIRAVGGGPTFDQPMPPDLAALVRGQVTSVVFTFQGDLVTVYTNGRQLYALPNRKFLRGGVLRLFLGGQNDTDRAVYLAGVRVAAGVQPALAVASSSAALSGSSLAGALSGGLTGPVTAAGSSPAPGTVVGAPAPVPVAVPSNPGVTAGPVAPGQSGPLTAGQTAATTTAGATAGTQPAALPASSNPLPNVSTSPTTATTTSANTGRTSAPIVGAPIASAPVQTSTSSSGQTTASAIASSTQPVGQPIGTPPKGLSVTGTPTTATVQWLAVTGATEYEVLRADRGTTAWTAVTPTRITSTVSPTDQLPDHRTSYTYAVTAYQADGSYGTSTIDYVPPAPQDPASLSLSAVTSSAAVISWQPVSGAWEYLVSGPGITPSALTSSTSFAVAPPGGTGVYQVASVYQPGGVLTPQSAWPSVSVSLAPKVTSFAVPGTTSGSTAPAPSGATTSCACSRTGAFARPALRTITAGSLTSGFTHPTHGSFTVTAQSVAGSVTLDVTDAQGRVMLSVPKPAAWGVSRDYRHFAVVGTPATLNTPAPITVYRVGPGTAPWPAVIGTMVDADGRWAFSTGGKIFLITRYQNSPIRFSFQAYDLDASNPGAAVQLVSEANVFGPDVSTSPCDDRLMYFRWTQRQPLTGQADYYQRTLFGRGGAVVAPWDGVSSSTPSASIITGTTTSSFLVQLSGLTVGGQTTMPSLQCSP